MLGLPKGSLEESTRALFGRAGYKITVSSRSYRPVIDDPELDGRFVRSQEMSRYVEHGFFDCGLCGHDWVVENGSDVVEVCELGYSRASRNPVRWVIAVPEDSAIKSVADLNGKPFNLFVSRLNDFHSVKIEAHPAPEPVNPDVVIHLSFLFTGGFI